MVILQSWECCTGIWTQKTMRTMRNCGESEKQEDTITWYHTLIFIIIFFFFYIYLSGSII